MKRTGKPKARWLPKRIISVEARRAGFIRVALPNVATNDKGDIYVNNRVNKGNYLLGMIEAKEMEE